MHRRVLYCCCSPLLVLLAYYYYYYCSHTVRIYNHPTAVDTTKSFTIINMTSVVKDITGGEDYRGFIFLVHIKHGLLLLRCTRKKSKPPHWQLPGGHIDEPEYVKAAQQYNTVNEQLLNAGKSGAARELFEETGIDVRKSLHRLQPTALRIEPEYRKNGQELLSNEYKHRLFFLLNIDDNDFHQDGTPPIGIIGKHLRLKLSHEHSGYTFQPEPSESAEMLRLHSGGKCSEALIMAHKCAMAKAEQEQSTNVKNNNEQESKEDTTTNESNSLDTIEESVKTDSSGKADDDNVVIDEEFDEKHRDDEWEALEKAASNENGGTTNEKSSSGTNNESSGLTTVGAVIEASQTVTHPVINSNNVYTTETTYISNENGVTDSVTTINTSTKSEPVNKPETTNGNKSRAIAAPIIRDDNGPAMIPEPKKTEKKGIFGCCFGK